MPYNPWVLLVYAMTPLALAACATVLKAKERRALIPVLKQCGLVNLGFTVLYALAVLVNQYV